MRNLLLFLVFSLLAGTTVAGPRTAPAHLVELRADHSNAYSAIRAPAHPGKGAIPTATFIVEYEGFPDEARVAFQYAVDVWSTLIASPVPIRIQAKWTDLPGQTLGQAGATYLYSDFGAGMPNTWYPGALADALAGFDQAPDEADIVAHFNAAYENWHFGTSIKPPAGMFDLATVVMHEIGHGLGFSGSMRVDDGNGSAECNGFAGTGCWGHENYPNVPQAYDLLIADYAGQSLLNDPPYPNLSTTLGQALMGESLQMIGAAAVAANDGFPVPVYSPTLWDQGSSYSHLDETTFPAGHPSSLMTPRLSMAEVVHDPGPIGCGVLSDLGWSVTPACGATHDPPPVPLATPATLSPADQQPLLPVPVTLYWTRVSGAGDYVVQVSSDFPSPEDTTVYETTADTLLLTELNRDAVYRWRVRGRNAETMSGWSPTVSFHTAPRPPGVPVLLSPANEAAIDSSTVRLRWSAVESGDAYHIQVATNGGMSTLTLNDSSMVEDALSFEVSQIGVDLYWRVRAKNEGGWGSWTAPQRFYVAGPTSATVDRTHSFRLEQNHPNPFNQSTTIRFGLREPGSVRLRVVDMLGRTVAVVLDAYRSAGRHEVRFEANRLPAGTYLYQLEASGSVATGVMQLIR